MSMQKKEAEKSLFKWVVVTLGVFWLIPLSLLAIYWNKLPEQLPWFYSQPWGEDQLIGKEWMVLVMGVLGVILGLDAFWADKLKRDEEFLSYILLWGGVATAGLVFISFVKVLLIIL